MSEGKRVGWWKCLVSIGELEVGLMLPLLGREKRLLELRLRLGILLLGSILSLWCMQGLASGMYRLMRNILRFMGGMLRLAC